MSGLMVVAGSCGAGIASGPSEIEFVGVANQVNPTNDAGSIPNSLIVDAGAVTDDLLLAFMISAGGEPVVSAPNWTQLGSTIWSALDVSGAVFYRVADGSATDELNYEDTEVSGQRWTSSVLVYREVDSEDPIGDSDGQATASGTSHSTPSITPVAENSMIVALFGLDADGAASWTPPENMDERLDITTASFFLSKAGYDVLQESTDAVSKTAVSSATKAGVAFIVALTPA